MTTIGSTNGLSTIPNGGCSTFEENKKAMDKADAVLKKVDQTVDKFIKTEEGIAKKEKIKKNLAAGILVAVGVATTTAILIKSGKIDKLVNGVKKLFSKKTLDVSEAMQDGVQEIQQNASKFKEIEFHKGIATDKNGKLFTGIIDDVVGSKEKGTLKKVKLEYENGIIKKSAIDDKIVREYFRDGDVLKIKKTQQMADGALKISESRFSDKKIAYLDRLREEKLPDGTERKWFNSTKGFENQLRYEKLPDGTEKEWYINGQLKCEKLFDGTKKSYNMCGQLDFKYLPDGTLRSYKDGQLIQEVLPDGTERFFE